MNIAHQTENALVLSKFANNLNIKQINDSFNATLHTETTLQMTKFSKCCMAVIISSLGNTSEN